MRAARLFVGGLQSQGLLAQVARVHCGLYGSLGATGKGHGSDKAVLLGLFGHDPETVPIDAVGPLVESIRSGGRIALMGEHEVAWNDREDLSFFRQTLPFHANGMRLSAWDAGGALLAERLALGEPLVILAAVAVLVSLLVSFTLTPMMSARLLGAEAAGFDAHLVKPVNPAALTQLLAFSRPEQGGTLPKG